MKDVGTNNWMEHLDVCSSWTDYITGLTDTFDATSASAISSSSPAPVLPGWDDEEKLENIKNHLNKHIEIPKIIPVGSDEVKIGLTTLSVPPEDIDIRDTRGSQAVSGLRTNTEALIKTGRGVLEIRMTLKFPDVTAINTQLRPLIAQFRTLPYTTLTSDFIANAVLKRQVVELDSARQAELNKRIEFATQQLNEVKERIRGRLQTISPANRSSLEQMLTNATSEKKAYDYRATINQAVNQIYQTFKTSSGKDEPYLNELTNELALLPSIMAEREQLRQALTSLDNKRSKDLPPIVPVVMASLAISPNVSDQGHMLKDAAKATLLCYYFNYAPFSPGFEFKNPHGDPIQSIEQCVAYRAYVDRRFLRGSSGLGLSIPSFSTRAERPLGEFQPNEEGLLGFRFPTTIMERVPVDDRRDRYLNPVREVTTTKNTTIFPSRFTVPLIERGQTSFINLHEDLVFQPDDPNLIIEALTVRLENKLAMQPIEGSLHPTYQFLGGTNATIQLVTTIVGSDPDHKVTHDQTLRKLQYMKSESETVALSGPRMRRHHKIFMANNYSILAGVQAVQLTDFRVIAPPPGRGGGPFQTTVAMEFVEFRVTQETREQLIGGLPYHHEEVDLALRFATDYYWRGKGKTPKPISRITAEGKIEKHTDTHSIYEMLGKYLFGTDHGKKAYGVPYALAMHMAKTVGVTLNIPNPFKFSDRRIEACIKAGFLKKVEQESWPKLDEPTQKVYRAYIRGWATRGVGYKQYYLYWVKIPAEYLPAEVLEKAQPYFNYHVSVPGILNEDVIASAMLQDPDLKAQFVLAVNTPLGESWGDAATDTAKSVALEFIRNWSKGPDAEHGFTGFGVGPRLTKKPDSKMVAALINLSMGEDMTLDPIIGSEKEFKPLPYRIDPQKNLRDRVLKMSAWMADNIPEYAALLVQMNKVARDRSTYPDLDLPTFEQAFPEVFRAIDEWVSGITDLNQLSPKVKQWLRKFIPTYQDLGMSVSTKIGGSRHDLARQRWDLVDPDFIWYHWRTQDMMEEVREFYKKEFGTEADNSKGLEIFGPSRGSGVTFEQWKAWRRATRFMPESNLTQETYQKFLEALENMSGGLFRSAESIKQEIVEDIGRAYTNELQKAIDSDNEKDPDTVWLPGSGATIDTVLEKRSSKPGQDYRPHIEKYDKMVKEFDPLSAKYNRALNRKILDTTRDDRWRMNMCFPTFQLYFIEKDSEEWSMLDDVFGYMSVSELHVYKHKFQSAVASIILVNMSGNLDESMESAVHKKRYKFKSPTSIDKALGSIWGVVAGDPSLFKKSSDLDSEYSQRVSSHSVPGEDLEPGTGEDRYADHFFLGVGTMIAIKMGYSSKPDDLETVFVGQIAELKRGDTIQIIAQDYSTELTVPLDTHKGRMASDAPALIDYIMDESPSEHYGTWDPFTLFAKEDDDRWGLKEFMPGENYVPDESKRMALPYGYPIPGFSVVGATVRGLENGYTSVRNFFMKRFGNRKLENVWYPKQGLVYKFLSFGKEWIIPHKSGLETLHELSRHNPGWVAASRPYDLNGMTLFFGKPGQPYFYTAWGQQAERKWAKKRPQVFTMTAEKLEPVLAGFQGSKFHDDYKLYESWHDSGVPSKILGTLERFATSGPGSPFAIPAMLSVELKIGRIGLRTLARWFFNSTDEGIGASLSNALAWIRGWAGDFDYPGSILVSLADWHGKLDLLTQAQRGDDDSIRHLLHKEFESDPNFNLLDVSPLPFLEKKAFRQVTSGGDSINSGRFKHAVNHIIKMQKKWKAFITKFNEYLSWAMDNHESKRKVIKVLLTAAMEAEEYEFNPRQKPFRNYHHADSTSNIIHNGIRASRDQMDNTVIVEYPNSISSTTTTKYTGNKKIDVVQFNKDVTFRQFKLPYSHTLSKDERKVRTVTEPNAENNPMAERCAYSNLAEAMRPMYRGDLILRGNERINPWDIISVADTYNGIYGPIEVESVTHHFTFEVGFLSKVTPHAVVIPNSHSDYQHCLFRGLLTGMLAFAGQVVSVGGGIGLLTQGYVGIPLGIGAILFGVKGISSILEASTGAGVWGNIMGRAHYGGRLHPIDFLPLSLYGLPYVVGLRKLGPQGFVARWASKWRKISRRASMDWFTINKIAAGSSFDDDRRR